jgi:hypothetical protein
MTSLRQCTLPDCQGDLHPACSAGLRWEWVGAMGVRPGPALPRMCQTGIISGVRTKERIGDGLRLCMVQQRASLKKVKTGGGNMAQVPVSIKTEDAGDRTLMPSTCAPWCIAARRSFWRSGLVCWPLMGCAAWVQVTAGTVFFKFVHVRTLMKAGILADLSNLRSTLDKDDEEKDIPAQVVARG